MPPPREWVTTEAEFEAWLAKANEPAYAARVRAMLDRIRDLYRMEERNKPHPATPLES